MPGGAAAPHGLLVTGLNNVLEQLHENKHHHPRLPRLSLPIGNSLIANNKNESAHSVVIPVLWTCEREEALQQLKTN